MTENKNAMNIRLLLGRSDVMMLVNVLHRAAEGEFPGLDRTMAREANDLASLLLFAVEDADVKAKRPDHFDGTWQCPTCFGGMEGCDGHGDDR